MKKIKINTPDGKTLTLNTPDGATPEQIKQAATSAISNFKSKVTSTPSTENPGVAKKEPGMLGKAWDALAVPAQKSKEGWDMIAQSQAVKPNLTGNLATDVIRGTPKVLAETAAEVAPAFIDRTAMLTAGAGLAAKGAAKVGGAILPKVAPMLEAGSGLQKGTLVAAFKDPKMIMDFGGRLKASALYNSIKEGATVPKHLQTNAKVVSDAMNQMSKGRTLTAPDAFKARKAVNALMKSKQYPMDDLLKTKEGLEAMVFSSVSKADQMYIRAIRGENMRHISRLNKNGTTGPISAAVMAKIPFLAPFLSPAIQGGAASAAGAVAQVSPKTIMNASTMVSAGLDRLKTRKEKSRGKR